MHSNSSNQPHLQQSGGSQINFKRTSSEAIQECYCGSSVAIDFEAHESVRSAPPMLSHPHFDSPTIRIRFQRAQLVLVAFVLVVMIGATMWLCAGDGVLLETFVAAEKDEPARKRLLDKYNSLSGNAVSALIKPLEYFVAIALALALLCFATEFALGPNTARYHRVLLVLVAGTGYLLTTGFNAINVQLAPRRIEAVMSVQDLSLSATGDAIVDIDSPEQKRSKATADMANRTLVEESPDNPITNTVFRSWALALEVNPPTQCFQENNGKDRTTKVTKSGAVSALYRIPGRAWFADAFPTALKSSKQLKFVAENSTGTARAVPTLNSSSGTVKLPMSRNRAMKLLADAIHNADRLFFSQPQWGVHNSAVMRTANAAFDKQFTGKNASAMLDDELPTLMDLMIKDTRDARGAALSDADVVQVMANMALGTFSPDGVRGPKVDVEFSHFDLSDDLTFDAVTVEFPSHKGFLQQRLAGNASAPTNTVGDQYVELDALTGCSLSACVLLNNSSSVKPQIFAFRACVDDPENDAVRFRDLKSAGSYPGIIVCSNTSNTSLTVVSVGVRIEGDEISHGSIGTGSSKREIIRLKNARKVYSLTVGRLSWETVDLAALYGAECAGDDASLCRGIRYKLRQSKGSKRRHVLASGKRVPLDALSNYYYDFNDVPVRYLSLVELPTIPSSFLKTEDQILSTADMVLPRRFGRSSLPKVSDVNSTACSAQVEDFLFHMEMNHLYIEKSLQPAYAAAVSFLFQDGVVRDEVDDNRGDGANNAAQPTGAEVPSTVTLGFLNNRQLVDVRLSSPLLNIALTLVGCTFILALSLAIAMIGASSESKLERLANAHNVVEMLVDTTKFPAVLLTKSIFGSTEATDEHQSQQQPDVLDEIVRVKQVKLARHGADTATVIGGKTPAGDPAVVSC